MLCSNCGNDVGYTIPVNAEATFDDNTQQEIPSSVQFWWLSCVNNVDNDISIGVPRSK